MSKLRVAILFSGQPRCVDGLAYQGFKKCILDRYDVDVYAHFWNDTESQKSTGTTFANIERFKQLYNPKAIVVDSPLRGTDFPLAFIQPHSPVPLTHNTILGVQHSNWAYWVRNCVSAYTSLGRVYELFQAQSSGIKYDWIIRTRTDCVLLRCPELDKLNPEYLYAPQWHSLSQGVIVNHALIVSPSIAPSLFRIRDTLEQLPGAMDEDYIFNRLRAEGVLPRVRTLPMYVFYPTLTRDGRQTDRPEPALKPEIVNPPYPAFAWTSSDGTSAWKNIQLG